tara:strand:+ start:448 stop:1065 length:618 start_codon:yes stop_codon:yes gene_type:complete
MTDTSVLDALVTRNIGDIEGALLHARKLGHELLDEIAARLRQDLGEGWEAEADLEDDGNPVKFAKTSWREPDASLGDGYVFNFNEKPGPNEETDETWFSTLLNAGPNGASIAIYLWSDTFWAKRRWRKLVQQEAKTVEKLLEAGFRQDDDLWIYIPLVLHTDELAKGYEQGDLETALMPVSQIAEVIKSTLPQLEALIERDRNFE